MTVTIIIDIFTSSCDDVEKVHVKLILSAKATTRDIATTLHVVEEGGSYLD